MRNDEIVTKKALKFHGSEYILIPAKWIWFFNCPKIWLMKLDKKKKKIIIEPFK
jgi:hypothetical protein